MLLKRKKLSMLVALLSSTVGAAALAPQVFAQEDDDMLEEVIVSGFRAAQAAAIDNKRNSTNSVESIIAEDVGKMPDLNLAESLQRAPGVAISREGGEGRKISVRGLGPSYSRVTLNGMEIPASTGGLDSSGGVNRGRDFDFNMFSADLFSRMDINKNYTARIEEGGMASTVELYTMKPLDNPGFQANGAVQGAYNVHSGEFDPRVTGLISNSFMDDSVGVLFGVNHSTRAIRQDGFGTVRWTSPTANGGRSWVDNPDLAVNGATGADIGDELGDDIGSVNDLFAPRLPRMDSFNHDTTRTSYMLALQGRPTDELELGLTYMSSQRESDVESYNLFAQFRNTFDVITPNSLTLDSDGRYIKAGSFSGVTPRSESRGQYGTSDFDQVIGDLSYVFTDTLRLDVMLGQASSEHAEEQYRYNLTFSAPTTFDYSFLNNSNVPTMSYGTSITDPANYGWTGPHHRRERVTRENTTFKVDLTWDFDDKGSNLKTGIISNERSIDSYYSEIPVGLTVPNDPSTSNTSTMGDFNGDFGNGIDAPSGFPTDWLIADIGVARSEYNAGDWRDMEVGEKNQTKNYLVNEDTLGAYVEANYYIGDFTLNGGLRWVETTVGGGASPIEESYSNLLPAINAIYEPMDDVLFRASWSENISRPNPSNLSGAILATPINGSVSIANPGLEPETSESYDLGVEVYFAEESYLGMAYFRKTIGNSITSVSTQEELDPVVRDIVAADPVYDPNDDINYDPSAADPNGIWDVTRSSNASEMDEINGVEISLNYMSPIGVGFLANYTYIASDDIVTGLSPVSYNLGAFYETDVWAARLLMNARDDYQTGGAKDGNLTQNNTGPTRMDFSGSYNITDVWTATLEVINLTNEKERNFTTGPIGDLDLVREYNSTGTELIFGIRAAF
ncbi:TonB-dependent receptor [Teredinibacter franksiae]|uniref:TonB-dependent receptor n=1 Tax=Cellvibrionaceae bacterium Bsc2 TaxID=1500540 RepID=A0A0D3MF68_9GAMM|nr:TonB-dependent receptor [Teredinibacter franksiae]AIH07696.1 TonB-dependent receptor [Cellvibrionaceae bacterium Bsc2]